MIVNDDLGIAQIIAQCRVIAVVGLSARVDRPSFEVASAMQQHGYRVIPVNPNYQNQLILGELCYADLADIPVTIDMVNCFRRSEEMELVANALKSMKPAPQVLWMQRGISSIPAAQIAADLGLKVVMDRCWKIEHGKRR